MKTRRYVWVLLLVVVVVSACSRSADDPPSVKILWPRDQHALALGEVFRVESRTRDDHGINRIELSINGVQVAVHDVPQGEKSYRVEQSWLPSGAGTYVVAVVAYDSKDQASEPAMITITVQPAPTETLPPSSTRPLTPATASPQPIGCTHRLTSVTDVSIPDNTQLDPELKLTPG